MSIPEGLPSSALAIYSSAELASEILSRTTVGGVVMMVGEADATEVFQKAKVDLSGKTATNVWSGVNRKLNPDVQEAKGKLLHFMHLVITQELKQFKAKYGVYPPQFKGMVDPESQSEGD